MDAPDSRSGRSPQEIVRSVLELCADCDSCRDLIEEECSFLPELYRLWDRQAQSGVPVPEAKLRGLVELCTGCGLCPCPRIPADVMEAKTRYVEQEGLPLAVRLLTDVPRMARVCGTFPRVVDALQSNGAIGPLLRKLARIHPDRQLPSFAKQDFFQWAAKSGLTERQQGNRNVAYFAGCTAGYLFPEVGRALVQVLQRNGVTVHVPPQQCCGMPHLVEGDRSGTLQKVRSNLGQLLLSLRAGDDLVCSCPTCGFLMKVLLRDKAYYSEAYQASVLAGEDELKFPDPARGTGEHRVLKKSIYKDILKDDGYFSRLDPMNRIAVAEGVADAGEYLARLHAEGRLDTRFGALSERVVYFAPCHQREQKIGRPYLELLRLIPGMTVEPVGEMECCGMGGNFGFKVDFHERSLAVGRSVFARIRELAPEAVVTDCISCRLQFSHALPHPVFHPMEILARAYATAEPRGV